MDDLKLLAKSAIAISVAFSLGFISSGIVRKPCPYPDIMPPSQATIQREIRRDSIAKRRAIRAELLDSLSQTQSREINIRIARNLSRRAQLDSLLTDPR